MSAGRKTTASGAVGTLLELNPDGTLDTAGGFPAGSQAFPASEGPSDVTALQIISNNVLLVGGQVSYMVGGSTVDPEQALAEYDLDPGMLDTSFGGYSNGGGLTAPPGEATIFDTPQGVESISVQADGNILISAFNGYIERVIGNANGVAPQADDDVVDNSVQVLDMPSQLQTTLQELPSFFAPLFSSSASTPTLTLNGTGAADNIEIGFDSVTGDYDVTHQWRRPNLPRLPDRGNLHRRRQRQRLDHRRLHRHRAGHHQRRQRRRLDHRQHRRLGHQRQLHHGRRWKRHHPARNG